MKVFIVVVLVSLLLIGQGFSPKRSERWDTHLKHHLSQRSSAKCNWQSTVDDDGECTLSSITSDDELGRRESGLLSPPQYQGVCGSCWAFSAAHTYTDHRNIAAQEQTPVISAQHLAACFDDDKFVSGGNGCCGANIVSGFFYFNTNGAVTADCAPYVLQEYGETSKADTPVSEFCPSECADNTTFQPELLKLEEFTVLTSQEEVFEALKTGPVLSSMLVPTDFSSYKCGVYCTSTDENVGGHAIEVVDYGTTSDDVDFWVVKNSWSEFWGEGGYFRIRRDEDYFALGGLYLSPVVSSNEPVPVDIRTCSEEEMETPQDDELILSAIEHVLGELISEQVITCPNTSITHGPISLVVLSITEASVQVVDGVWIMVSLLVDIRTCDPVAQADLNATVFISVNNTFNLTDHNYDYIIPSAGFVMTTNLLLLVAMIMAAIFLT